MKNENILANMLGLLTAPLIVYPSPWKADIPEWMIREVTLQRLIQLKSGETDLATDAEALAYIFPAVMEAPIDHEWSKIYLYLGTRVMENRLTKDHVTMPGDVREDSLSEYETGQLNRLKRWIRERQFKHLAEKMRDLRREEKAEELKRQAEENPRLELIFEPVAKGDL